MNKREERMLDQLSGLVPANAADDIAAFREAILQYDALGAVLRKVPVDPVDNERLFLIGRNTWVGGMAMKLLKKHTGKKVLVVYASGRTEEEHKLWPEIMRIDPIIRQLPKDDWLVFVGGGKSGMKVARAAGHDHGLTVVASHFYSESAVQGKSSELHDLDIDFGEFVSREAIFAEVGDAFLAAVSGLGGLGEDSGVISKSQMKMLPKKPFFFLWCEVLDQYLAYMQTLATNGLCDEADLYYEVLKPHEDGSFFKRLSVWEAAHPYLADWQKTMIAPGGSPFRLIPPDSGGVATKTT